MSPAVRGRPEVRWAVPSYLWAINFRCHTNKFVVGRAASAISNGNAGVASSIANVTRQLQLSMKFLFWQAVAIQSQTAPSAKRVGHLPKPVTPEICEARQHDRATQQHPCRGFWRL